MESTQGNKNASNVLNIPTAIVIAGAIIALGIIYTKTPVEKKVAVKESSFEESVKPITSADYIMGNPNAKIKIVEYSDPSCPYCKVFHNTMRKIMTDYGNAGNVSWVYRSYPLLSKPNANGQIPHPNAVRESEAMECAGSLGGNEKFWKFANRLYEITPSVTNINPNGLDQKELPKIAEYTGLNVDDFNNCVSTGKFKEKIEANLTEGLNIGIYGTPSSIIMLNKVIPAATKEKIMQIYEAYKDPNTGEYPVRLSADAKMLILDGAMPYESVKATIDLLFTY